MYPKHTANDFWALVDRTGDCWEWRGALDSKGYGRFSYTVDGYKTNLAPRVAWYLSHGEMPIGRCVLHHCDNPPCVRPEHLFLGSKADNNADRAAKGRSVKGDAHWTRVRPELLHRGEAHGRAKLTADAVLEARRLRAEGWSWPRLAKHFGVRHYTMQLAVSGRTWSHL